VAPNCDGFQLTGKDDSKGIIRRKFCPGGEQGQESLRNQVCLVNNDQAFFSGLVQAV